jgi:uncharacterized protein (TIGR02145 family)
MEKTLKTISKILMLFAIGLLVINCSDSNKVVTGETGTVTDIDGNVYSTIGIGNKMWMAENLKVTKFSDGTAIPNITDDTEWMNANHGAYSIRNFDDVDEISTENEMKNAYGILYNWKAATDPKGLCPTGWRLPTHDELREMVDYITENYEEINSNNAGNYLKSCRQVNSQLGGSCNTENHPRWDSDSNHYGNDFFGFKALPAGYRSATSVGAGKFLHFGRQAHFWTSTDAAYGGYPYVLILSRSNGGAEIDGDSPNMGVSVRCVNK